MSDVPSGSERRPVRFGAGQFGQGQLDQGQRRPRRKHTAVMREILTLDGVKVADVGCGDGRLLRFLVREGAAEAIGIEPSPVQLAKARAAEAAGGERYLEAGAEALPLDDASLDLVIFFNSLHHVPSAGMGKAIAEAARVLRRGGLLFVMEPLAEGPYFELMRVIEDETEVRAQAYARLRKAADAGFEEICEMIYDAPFSYPSFEACEAGSIAIEPSRAALFDKLGDSLRRGFHQAARRHGDAFWFTQASRLNLLSRT